MEKLYKYKGITDDKSLDRVIDIIKSHKIYVSARSKLNAPAEGEHILNISLGICGS